MSEEEDRLRELLRAPIDDAAPVRFELARFEPARFEPVRSGGRVHRAATITLVMVLVALIAGTVTVFRGMADRSQPVAQRSTGANVAPPSRHVPVAALTRNVPCNVGKSFADRAQLRAFHPVVALRCAAVMQGSDLVQTRAVTDGPFGALVRDLERPDGESTAGQMCAMYMDVQPRVLLVDAAGRYLRPRFPRNGCGHVHGTPAYIAYLHLTWHQEFAPRADLHRTR